MTIPQHLEIEHPDRSETRLQPFTTVICFPQSRATMGSIIYRKRCQSKRDMHLCQAISTAVELRRLRLQPPLETVSHLVPDIRGLMRQLARVSQPSRPVAF